MQLRETVKPTKMVDFFDYAPAKTVMPKIPIYFPKMKLHGRGLSGWLSGGDIAKYRFREFKLPKLSKLLKGWF